MAISLNSPKFLFGLWNIFYFYKLFYFHFWLYIRRNKNYFFDRKILFIAWFFTVLIFHSIESFLFHSFHLNISSFLKNSFLLFFKCDITFFCSSRRKNVGKGEKNDYFKHTHQLSCAQDGLNWCCYASL